MGGAAWEITLLTSETRMNWIDNNWGGRQPSRGRINALDTHILQLCGRLPDFLEVLLEVQLDAGVPVLLLLDEDELLPGLANLLWLLFVRFIWKDAKSGTSRKRSAVKFETNLSVVHVSKFALFNKKT